MTQEKATELATACFGETRKAGSPWPVGERASFLKECRDKTGKKSGTAKTYCNCMLAKIEKAYPNPLDAEKMAPEELNAWAKDCGGRQRDAFCF